MRRLDLMSAEARPISGDVDALVRSVLLAAVFLVLWIGFRPFQDLSIVGEVTESGNLVNQVGYSVLFAVLSAWMLNHEPSRLLLLLRPLLIATVLWFALSTAVSWEPALSARRLTFTLVAMGISAMAMLVPRNVRHFGDVLAAVVLLVLVLCYLGVMLAPSLAIHQATDVTEPELAGDWRGLFAHKNEAAATMATFVFIGLFIARSRSRLVGAAIVVASTVFLVFTQSKTSVAMLPVVLLVSALIGRWRSPAPGIAIAAMLALIFNVLAIGSLYSESIRRLLDVVLTDSTFTGRTDVWQFALDHIRERPLTGFGFEAFWGTPEVVYGMGGNAVWANVAGHAHNGYLDLAVTIGLPGAVLVTLWLFILPLADFYRAGDEAASAPLKMMFLRVCLFAAFASSFESLLLQEGGASIFLFVASFGLRLLSVSRVRA